MIGFVLILTMVMLHMVASLLAIVAGHIAGEVLLGFKPEARRWFVPAGCMSIAVLSLVLNSIAEFPDFYPGSKFVFVMVLQSAFVTSVIWFRFAIRDLERHSTRVVDFVKARFEQIDSDNDGTISELDLEQYQKSLSCKQESKLVELAAYALSLRLWGNQVGWKPPKPITRRVDPLQGVHRTQLEDLPIRVVTYRRKYNASV